MSDGERGDPGDAPQAVEGEEDGEIDALFAPKSSRRRKDESEEHKAELLSDAADLVARMEHAAKADARLRSAGALATEKLRLLPEVERTLRRLELRAALLDNQLLSALALWLRPAEDGALPPATLRCSLLRLCCELRLDTGDAECREMLKRSGLGRCVMHLKAHEPVESQRAAATRLVDDWSRPIFSLSAAYAQRPEREEEEVPQRGAQRERAAAEEAEEAEEAQGARGAKEQAQRHFAVRPEPTRLDFTVRPKSTASGAAQPKAKEAAGSTGAKIVKARALCAFVSPRARY